MTRSFFSDEVNNAVPALWSVCSSANVVSGWLFIDIEGVSTSRWLKSNHKIINVKNSLTTKNKTRLKRLILGSRRKIKKYPKKD